MFGLLSNLVQWVKKKSERRIAVVVLGLDNAGKTSIFNTLNGAGHQDTTPSFGFTKSSLKEGKYTVDLYDLGGGKNIRRIWNTYLPEVHGAIYVVDAADPARFPESKQVLDNVLADRHLAGKPILVLANKQDLPAASQPHEVAAALGLDQCIRAQYNIRPTCAKRSATQLSDRTIGDSFRWLVHAVDATFGALAPRVVAEAEAHRQEELRKKREREERARAMREERLRREKEAAEQQLLLQQQESGLQATVQLKGGVSIDSPLCSVPPPRAGPAAAAAAASDFVDLEKASKELVDRRVVVGAAAAGADAELQRRPLLSPLLPPCNNRVTPVVATP